MKTIVCLAMMGLLATPCAFAAKETTPYEVLCTPATRTGTATMTITVSRETQVAEVSIQDSNLTFEIENYAVSKQENKDLKERNYIGNGFALYIQVDNVRNPATAKFTFHGSAISVEDLSCEINDFVSHPSTL